jgi:hypothetical protein
MKGASLAQLKAEIEEKNIKLGNYKNFKPQPIIGMISELNEIHIFFFDSITYEFDDFIEDLIKALDGLFNIMHVFNF